MFEQSGRHGMTGTLARKLATARGMTVADLSLVALCWGLIGAMALRVALLPSRRVLRSLGRNLGAVTRAPAIGPRDRDRALRIARAIAIAADNAPFRADCWPQALAAAQLCRWSAIPHAVQLGARFGAADGERAGRLEGHAWVRAGGLTVCGGAASAAAFGTVACFVHPPSAAA